VTAVFAVERRRFSFALAIPLSHVGLLSHVVGYWRRAGGREEAELEEVQVEVRRASAVLLILIGSDAAVSA
jgi:hypothetical protein